MRYVEHAPCPALRPYIDAYWTIAATEGAPAHRVLPDGCIDLLFDGADGARVVGPMTRAIVTPAPAPGAFLFGVRFAPGEAAQFLRITARDVRDDAIAIDDVWGALGRDLDDSVSSARSIDARVREVERVLLARLAALHASKHDDVTAARVRASIGALRASPARVSVEALAGRLGIAPRTLERIFDERVGVGPKHFARVARLQRVVATIDRAAVSSWSALAADLDFADQAHLVREVRDLAGATPTELTRERRALSDSFNTNANGAHTVPPSPALAARPKEASR